MPQGIVIAIKPMGFVSDSEFMSASLAGAASAATNNPGNRGLNKEEKIFVIGKYRGEGMFHGPVEEVLWYRGQEGDFKEGQRVKFKINDKNPKSVKMEEAYEVKPHDAPISFIDNDKLSKVVLLASTLLILAFAFDRKR